MKTLKFGSSDHMQSLFAGVRCKIFFCAAEIYWIYRRKKVAAKGKFVFLNTPAGDKRNKKFTTTGSADLRHH